MEDIPEDIREAAGNIWSEVHSHTWGDGNYGLHFEPVVEIIARAIMAERERCEDKIDGLGADLDSAVEVAWKRGAHDWVRLNYPSHAERFQQQATPIVLDYVLFVALRDVASYRGPYCWKQASMRKLSELGFVEAFQPEGPPRVLKTYRITEAGKRYLKEFG